MISHKQDNEYQLLDYDVIDYEIYPIGDFTYRGPKPSFHKPYFSVIGSAHSFGRFCKLPFSTLLSQQTNLDCLNLSSGGLGPENYIRRFKFHNEALPLVNNSKFCIIQVMPGRSSSNSLFKTEGSINGYLENKPETQIDTNDFWLEKIKENNSIQLEKLVEETRQSYIDSYKEVFKLIKVPKVLFYFSERPHDYNIDYKNVNGFDELYGEKKGFNLDGVWQPKKGSFPQFVNSQVINELKKDCHYYIEYISSKGLPHILNNRFTSKPIKKDIIYKAERLQKFNGIQVNQYYPSQQMHIEAAEKLLPACNSILNDS